MPPAPDPAQLPAPPHAVRIEHVKTAHSGTLVTLCHHQRIQSLDMTLRDFFPARRQQGRSRGQHSDTFERTPARTPNADSVKASAQSRRVEFLHSIGIRVEASHLQDLHSPLPLLSGPA